MLSVMMDELRWVPPLLLPLPWATIGAAAGAMPALRADWLDEGAELVLVDGVADDGEGAGMAFGVLVDSAAAELLFVAVPHPRVVRSPLRPAGVSLDEEDDDEERSILYLESCSSCSLCCVLEMEPPTQVTVEKNKSMLYALVSWVIARFNFSHNALGFLEMGSVNRYTTGERGGALARVAFFSRGHH